MGAHHEETLQKRFYTILAEKRLKHPKLMAISNVARASLIHK